MIVVSFCCIEMHESRRSWFVPGIVLQYSKSTGFAWCDFAWVWLQIANISLDTIREDAPDRKATGAGCRFEKRGAEKVGLGTGFGFSVPQRRLRLLAGP